MFDSKAIGKNVKEARRKAGLSQSALADKVGFENGSKISRFETGCRTPSLEALDSIATALNTTLCALLDPDSCISRVSEINESPGLKRIITELAELNIKYTKLEKALIEIKELILNLQ